MNEFDDFDTQVQVEEIAPDYSEYFPNGETAMAEEMEIDLLDW